MPTWLLDDLVTRVRRAFPIKVFGYLVSDSAHGDPTDVVIFHENIRNARLWKPQFESYGAYFIKHSDAGFVASPGETLRVQKLLALRGQYEVGVFHTHQRHPANFSQIDYDLHIERFPRLWHLIVSLRNPRIPQVRAFDASTDGVSEIPLVYTNAGRPNADSGD